MGKLAFQRQRFLRASQVWLMLLDGNGGCQQEYIRTVQRVLLVVACPVSTCTPSPGQTRPQNRVKRSRKAVGRVVGYIPSRLGPKWANLLGEPQPRRAPGPKPYVRSRPGSQLSPTASVTECNQCTLQCTAV